MVNALLHISDMHICGTREPKSPDTVVAALRSLNENLDTVVIVVTGDIALSGKPQEYEKATAYFQKLRRLLAQETGEEIPLVVCPGNHDCDFSVNSQVRSMVVEHIRSRGELETCDDDVVRQCTSVQGAFFQWLKGLDSRTPVDGPCIAWVQDVTGKDGMRVSFRVLNTAWMSTLEEVQGQLLFPVRCIPDAESADLRITVFHHPLVWFQSANSRELRRVLDQSSDLILTGHEHDYDQYQVSRSTERSTGYVEGGVFGCDERDRSAFSVILVDSASSCYTVIPFQWCRDKFAASTCERKWTEFVCVVGPAVPRQRLSSEMRVFLDDPGLQLTHRAKTLTLEDIFVPPDLKTYERADRPGALSTTIVPSGSTMETLLADKYVYLLGEGQCGKTSLAKMLFVRAMQLGLTAVYLSGADLRKASHNALNRDVSAAVSRQYASLSSEEFWQIPKEKRVVFVDDFGDCPLNSTGKGEIIKWLKDRFGRIYLMSGDLTQVEELVAVPREGAALSGFRRYDIRPFGFLLRDLLIEKWITLGQEHLVEADELQHRLRQTAQTVNRMLGKHLLPASPAYILLLLQQLEAQVPLNTTSGSYGYFYETVLTLALSRASRSPEDVDAKYTFLSELAWYLHRKGERHIGEEDLDRFTSDHIERFRLNRNADTFLREVVESRLLKIRYGRYQFAYGYIFYYFVARYMRDNLEDSDVQTCIDEAARDIHREDCANILIFLTYLTKNRAVIARVIERARSLFESVPPSDFDDHVAFISRLQDCVPAIVLPDGNPQENRRAILKSIDDEDDQEPEAELECDVAEQEEADQAELDEFLSINSAIKTLQVLGQILRNFSGSLKRDLKLKITRECFDLGLRVFNSFCASLERHLSTTLFTLAELFGRDLNDLPVEQQVSAAKEFVFFVTEVMCLSTLRRISDAIGSEALVKIYEDVEGTYNTRATRFVQLSLRLDHCRTFPEKRIVDLSKEVGDDVFGITLLRMLVAEHFYLFERPYQVRQSICQKLGISYKKTHRPALIGSVAGAR